MPMDMPITTDNALQLIDNQISVAIHKQVSIAQFDTTTISTSNIVKVVEESFHLADDKEPMIALYPFMGPKPKPQAPIIID
ncbi:hypothetical protein [Shewanella surugensis]|uniref:Uncharacterized protein n=1 Tax=Shewanella surugensis TaxID=212020 RepID=A0ABT0L825_9GAMM|nr:hypothetical protein [Shewanella surugensis]MCL1123854.1 hypothetical protein [Shewanella surugensis]